MRRSLAEHRTILEAVSGGDAETAENAARDHVLVQVKEFSQLVRTWSALRAEQPGDRESASPFQE